MGTDIYLEYEGKPEKYTFKEGSYIRASIFSIKENTVLRMIFPKKYWEAGGPLRYRFSKKKLEELKVILNMYLKSYLENKKLECKEAKEYEEFGERVALLLCSCCERVEISRPENIEFARRWARSVISFFEKGLELEKEGRRPKVLISW